MAYTVAVASGKGGTGKTTFAVNLAAVADQQLTLLDCDVEEPNCHLFLPLADQTSRRFAVPVPDFDMSICDGCGACGTACRYKAIAVIDKKPMLFPELCHSCGGCVRACPTEAIKEVPMEIGTVYVGRWQAKEFAYGKLDIGRARSAPLIEYLRKYHSGTDLILIDAPPGTSCPTVAAVRGADLMILVTEPTPFGLNDLRLAVEMGNALGLAQAVVINRSDLGEADIDGWCRDAGIPIIARVPFSREIAEQYCRGAIIADHIPEFRKVCETVWNHIRKANLT